LEAIIEALGSFNSEIFFKFWNCTYTFSVGESFAKTIAQRARDDARLGNFILNVGYVILRVVYLYFVIVGEPASVLGKSNEDRRQL
jgi:hypothetical protein